MWILYWGYFSNGSRRWMLCRGEGHLYFKLDIILIKRLSKHTLNMYFSGMKIDPKYAFLHTFLICPSCPFQNLSIWPETHPFFQFCTYLHPKRCTRVHCVVLKNNPNYVKFLQGWYPTSNTSAPPPPGMLWLLQHILVFWKIKRNMKENKEL